MSGKTVTVNIGFYKPGDTIEIPVDFVKNTGDSIITGAKVTVTYPASLTYNSVALDQGTYVDGTKTWTIGTLTKGQSVGGYFYFDVVDDCAGPYTIVFDALVTGACDACLGDNQLCVVTNGVSCCAVRGCIDPKSYVVSAVTHTVLSTDEILEANASSNAIQFNLPTLASSYNTDTKRGKQYTFKVSDFSNGVTVVANGAEKILDNTNLAGASTTYTFSSVGESITIAPSETLTHWIVI